jgi:hypothetical protein
MHQTFYIDIDEEITSVIDRLRKSKSKENIFVIPQRALVLQSVINLRLLKKEADKLKRQIMIVSQDEQVRTISEKVGILFQSSMKGIEESEEVREKLNPKIRAEKIRKTPVKRTEKKKAEEIGSDSFFEGDKPLAIIPEAPGEPQRLERENLINKELIKDLGGIQKKEAGIFSGIKETGSFTVPESSAEVKSDSRPSITDILASKNKTISQYQSQDQNQDQNQFRDRPPQYKRNLDPIKEKNLNEIFHPAPAEEKAIQPERSVPSFTPYASSRVNQVTDSPSIEVPVRGKLKKMFIMFGMICLFIALLVGAYLFVPKAVVAVQLKNEVNKSELEARGETNISSLDIEKKIIPIKVIEKEKEKSLTFNPNEASSGASSQKAGGKITIYNEYSSAAQPLIATTRFLTSDGKLFRLSKDVTVPGTSKVENEIKPGVVEVDVLADKSGEEYKIGPSTFKIPGFEGGPKYEKFYAKSTESMSMKEVTAGGGIKGVISAQDIADAKEKVESELIKELEGEIKKEISTGQLVLGDDSEKTVLSSVSTVGAGKSAESFEYSAKIKIGIATASESDLKKLMKESGKIGETVSDSSIKINVSDSKTDIKSGTSSLKIKSEISSEMKPDLDKFKSAILGKNEREIREVMKNYPQIEGVEIDFKPSFLSGRVPRFSQRVEINVKK